MVSSLLSCWTREDQIPRLPRQIAFREVHEVTLWTDNPNYAKLGPCLIDLDTHKTFAVTEITIDAPRSQYFILFHLAMVSKIDPTHLGSLGELKKSEE